MYIFHSGVRIDEEAVTEEAGVESLVEPTDDESNGKFVLVLNMLKGFDGGFDGMYEES